MRQTYLWSLILFFITLNTFAKGPLIIPFNSDDYEFRRAKYNEYEFTPKTQNDLSTYTDKITIHTFESFYKYKSLEEFTKDLRLSYQDSGAEILSSFSTPTDAPTQHVMSLIISERDYKEICFVKYKLENGIGMSVTYSHRIYGHNTGKIAYDWFRENKDKLQQLILDFSSFPQMAELNIVSKIASGTYDDETTSQSPVMPIPPKVLGRSAQCAKLIISNKKVLKSKEELIGDKNVKFLKKGMKVGEICSLLDNSDYTPYYTVQVKQKIKSSPDLYEDTISWTVSSMYTPSQMYWTELLVTVDVTGEEFDSTEKDYSAKPVKAFQLVHMNKKYE